MISPSAGPRVFNMDDERVVLKCAVDEVQTQLRLCSTTCPGTSAARKVPAHAAPTRAPAGRHSHESRGTNTTEPYSSHRKNDGVFFFAFLKDCAIANTIAIAIGVACHL